MLPGTSRQALSKIAATTSKNGIGKQKLPDKQFDKPGLFVGLNKAPRSILLYGPPGNGKTQIALALAGECKATFFNVSCHELISLWQGQSEKMVAGVFELAYKNKPSIIFIDEAESLEIRCEILKLITEKANNPMTDEELTEIATATEGFSGRDLEKLCSEARAAPFNRKTYEQILAYPDEPVKVELHHFKEVLQYVTSSTTAEDRDRCHAFSMS